MRRVKKWKNETDYCAPDGKKLKIDSADKSCLMHLRVHKRRWDRLIKCRNTAVEFIEMCYELKLMPIPEEYISDYEYLTMVVHAMENYYDDSNSRR